MIASLIESPCWKSRRPLRFVRTSAGRWLNFGGLINKSETKPQFVCSRCRYSLDDAKMYLFEGLLQKQPQSTNEALSNDRISIHFMNYTRNRKRLREEKDTDHSTLSNVGIYWELVGSVFKCDDYCL